MKIVEQIKTLAAGEPKHAAPLLRVLIVDDAEPVRRGLRALLNKMRGVAVAGEASNVTDAIKAVRALRPEVVILDLNMPGISGLDVLTAAKEIKPSPVVIIYTMYSFDALHDLCRRAGANYFFDKASHTEDLLKVLQSLADAQSEKNPDASRA